MSQETSKSPAGEMLIVKKTTTSRENEDNKHLMKGQVLVGSREIQQEEQLRRSRATANNQDLDQLEYTEQSQFIHLSSSRRETGTQVVAKQRDYIAELIKLRSSEHNRRLQANSASQFDHASNGATEAAMSKQFVNHTARSTSLNMQGRPSFSNRNGGDQLLNEAGFTGFLMTGTAHKFNQAISNTSRQRQRDREREIETPFVRRKRRQREEQERKLRQKSVSNSNERSTQTPEQNATRNGDNEAKKDNQVGKNIGDATSDFILSSEQLIGPTTEHLSPDVVRERQKSQSNLEQPLSRSQNLSNEKQQQQLEAGGEHQDNQEDSAEGEDGGVLARLRPGNRNPPDKTQPTQSERYKKDSSLTDESPLLNQTNQTGTLLMNYSDSQASTIRIKPMAGAKANYNSSGTLKQHNKQTTQSIIVDVPINEEEDRQSIEEVSDEFLLGYKVKPTLVMNAEAQQLRANSMPQDIRQSRQNMVESSSSGGPTDVRTPGGRGEFQDRKGEVTIEHPSLQISSRNAEQEATQTLALKPSSDANITPKPGFSIEHSSEENKSKSKIILQNTNGQKMIYVDHAAMSHRPRRDQTNLYDGSAGFPDADNQLPSEATWSKLQPASNWLQRSKHFHVSKRKASKAAAGELTGPYENTNEQFFTTQMSYISAATSERSLSNVRKQAQKFMHQDKRGSQTSRSKHQQLEHSNDNGNVVSVRDISQSSDLQDSKRVVLLSNTALQFNTTGDHKPFNADALKLKAASKSKQKPQQPQPVQNKQDRLQNQRTAYDKDYKLFKAMVQTPLENRSYEQVKQANILPERSRTVLSFVKHQSSSQTSRVMSSVKPIECPSEAKIIEAANVPCIPETIYQRVSTKNSVGAQRGRQRRQTMNTEQDSLGGEDLSIVLFNNIAKHQGLNQNLPAKKSSQDSTLLIPSTLLEQTSQDMLDSSRCEHSNSLDGIGITSRPLALNDKRSVMSYGLALGKGQSNRMQRNDISQNLKASFGPKNQSKQIVLGGNRLESQRKSHEPIMNQNQLYPFKSIAPTAGGAPEEDQDKYSVYNQLALMQDISLVDQQELEEPQAQMTSFQVAKTTNLEVYNDHSYRIRQRQSVTNHANRRKNQAMQPLGNLLPDTFVSKADGRMKDSISVKVAQKTRARCAAEVAPWKEGKRHLNFGQRYRENQVNVSRTTYGLQTSQLKDLKQKLGHVTDFARHESTDAVPKSHRQSKCSADLRKAAQNYHGLSPYQSQQEKVSRAQIASRSNQNLAIKLVSYRSNSTEFRNADNAVESHKWAMPEQNRDLGELQRVHKEVTYVDLAERQNLHFHQMSEWTEEERPSVDRLNNSSGDEISKASKLPKDELTHYNELEKGFARLRWFETYQRQQLQERVQRLRQSRILMPSCDATSSAHNLSQQLQSDDQKSLDAKRQNIQEERWQVTKQLMKFSQHPKQFKDVVHKLSSNYQVSTNRKGQFKLLEALSQPPDQKSVQQKYTFKKPSSNGEDVQAKFQGNSTKLTSRRSSKIYFSALPPQPALLDQQFSVRAEKLGVSNSKSKPDNGLKQPLNHDSSQEPQVDRITAIIAIEGESNSSGVEQTTEKLNNSAFILVNPSGAVTDPGKHDKRQHEQFVNISSDEDGSQHSIANIVNSMTNSSAMTQHQFMQVLQGNLGINEDAAEQYGRQMMSKPATANYTQNTVPQANAYEHMYTKRIPVKGASKFIKGNVADQKSIVIETSMSEDRHAMTSPKPSSHLFCQLLDTRLEKILSHRYNSSTDGTATANSYLGGNHLALQSNERHQPEISVAKGSIISEDGQNHVTLQPDQKVSIIVESAGATGHNKNKSVLVAEHCNF